MFIQKYYYDFQSFVYTNRLLEASSGFIFAMISKDYIDRFLNDIIYPLIFSLIIFKTTLKDIENEYPVLYILLKFIWITFIWIATLFISFIILEYILNRNILGFSSTMIPNKDKNNYINMKVDAKVSGIIPGEKEMLKIDEENDLIDRKVNERYMNMEEFM